MEASSLLSDQLRSVALRLAGELHPLERFAQQEQAGRLIAAAHKAGFLDGLPGVAKLVAEFTPPAGDSGNGYYANMLYVLCGNFVVGPDGSVVPGVVDQLAASMPAADPLAPWNDRVLDDQQAAVCKWLAERVDGFVQNGESTETNKMSDSSEPVNSMRKTGNHWRITFAGQEALVGHRRGADHLRKLLAEPNVPILAGVLHGSTEGDLHANDPQVTRSDNAAELERVKRQLQELLDTEEEAARDREAGYATELSENHYRNKDGLLTRAKELAVFGHAGVVDGEVLVGRPRCERAGKAALVAVRQAINRFAKKVGAAGCPRFAEHVMCSIVPDAAAGTVTYATAKPPEWQF